MSRPITSIEAVAGAGFGGGDTSAAAGVSAEFAGAAGPVMRGAGRARGAQGPSKAAEGDGEAEADDAAWAKEVVAAGASAGPRAVSGAAGVG